MRCKKGHKEPKSLPYGATKGKYWCFGCDAEAVSEWYGANPKPIKKKERQKAKKNIKKELDEN